MLPEPRPQPQLVLRFATWSRRLAWLATALGALLFLQQRSTGIAFVLVGASLLISRRMIAAPLLLAAAAIGALIFADEPDTAVAFVLTGVALLLTGSRFVKLGQALAGVVALVALVALFGHLYSVKAFFGVTAYTKMSMGAVLAFLIVTVAAWLSRPEAGYLALVSSDGAAGFAARRLYPAVILLPLLLGALTLAGEEARLYNGKFGLSVLVLASIVVLVVVVMLASNAVDRSDHARLRLAAVLLEESERRHLARELHDEIGQSLTALKVRLEMIQPTGKEALELAQELMARVSSLSLDLRPAMLDDLGLLPALLWLFDCYRSQTGIVVEFSQEGLEGPRLPRERETAAYRIVQEALTNVARHSGAEQVSVRLFRRDGRLSLFVDDGGQGFDPEAVFSKPETSGLLGMRERAAALGGRLTIDAAAGQGTRLHAELPTT